MAKFMRWEKPEVVGQTPTIKNHSATLVDNKLFVFGGYDGRRNHSTVNILDCDTYTWTAFTDIEGRTPEGRNGHTATLAERKIYFIGGWLGSGPLAASDLNVLDIDEMRWLKPQCTGNPPGACNMHTADYVASMRKVLVFRGGDGRNYLNDLHGLCIDTYNWERVETTGEAPLGRANHASAVEGNNLFIFGGWDGHKRLNDIHVLDTNTLRWSTPWVNGLLPHPRAGMTFTCLRNYIYLFGGSGPSSKCFNDLLVFEPSDFTWIDTTVMTQDELLEHQATDSDTLSNPNDAYTPKQVILLGQGPGRRAGHTATVVGRKLLVFGGSFGSEYLNDFFVLDTDPSPEVRISAHSAINELTQNLRNFCNCEEFSDVTFIVEGQPIHSHRIILSMASERFRAMFGDGFREAVEREVVIPDHSYHCFSLMMEYLYSGEIVQSKAQSESIHTLLELLECSDQYMLDHLKEKCEALLEQFICDATVGMMLDCAERTNAWQLAAVCRHFARNHQSANEQDGSENGQAIEQAVLNIDGIYPLC